jgi:hypothetical protein
LIAAPFALEYREFGQEKVTISEAGLRMGYFRTQDIVGWRIMALQLGVVPEQERSAGEVGSAM